jgi:hypothetical protein
MGKIDLIAVLFHGFLLNRMFTPEQPWPQKNRPIGISSAVQRRIIGSASFLAMAARLNLILTNRAVRMVKRRVRP